MDEGGEVVRAAAGFLPLFRGTLYGYKLLGTEETVT